MVDKYIKKLADEIAEKEGLTDFEVEVNRGSKKGDGLLGDILTVSLKSQNKTIEMIFKRSIPDTDPAFNLDEMYQIEMHFYSNIVPEIQKFQSENKVTDGFTAVAKYFGFHFEDNVKIIALENLRNRGFELFSRTDTLDGQHVEMVCRQYGRLHAFSFAYRDKYPEKFAELVKPLKNMWYEVGHQDYWTNMLDDSCYRVIEMLTEDGPLKEKYKKYENGGKLLKNFTRYEGKYSAILHGDCWCNNMMFKYKNTNGNKQLEDVCLLDWQLCSVGTPIFDLSYFIYASCSKEIFDKLDYYLHVYHSSLSATLKEVGCDPDILFPFAALKQEWNKYCKFGFILGLLVHRLKLTPNDEMKDLRDVKEGYQPEPGQYFDSIKPVNEALVEERCRNLVIHMSEIDAL